MTLLFVGGSNRGTLCGSRQGRISPSPFCPNPSSMDLWIGFIYNFYITEIIVIVFIQRGSEETQVTINFIASTARRVGDLFNKRGSEPMVVESAKS